MWNEEKVAFGPGLTDRSQRNSCGIATRQNVVDIIHSDDPIGDKVRIFRLGFKAPRQEISTLFVETFGSGRQPLFHSVDRERDNRMSWSKSQEKGALREELVDCGDLANLLKDNSAIVT